MKYLSLTLTLFGFIQSAHADFELSQSKHAIHCYGNENIQIELNAPKTQMKLTTEGESLGFKGITQMNTDGQTFVTFSNSEFSLTLGSSFDHYTYGNETEKNPLRCYSPGLIGSCVNHIIFVEFIKNKMGRLEIRAFYDKSSRKQFKDSLEMNNGEVREFTYDTKAKVTAITQGAFKDYLKIDSVKKDPKYRNMNIPLWTILMRTKQIGAPDIALFTGDQQPTKEKLSCDPGLRDALSEAFAH